VGLIEELFRNNKTEIKITIDEDMSYEEFSEAFTKQFLDASEEISEDMVFDLTHNYKNFSIKYLRSLRGFNKRLIKRWDKPFRLLDLFLLISQEFGGMIWDEINPLSEENYLPYVLMRLHARACQISGELIALLKHGYGDGALSRWRSLYETMIIASFIEKHGARTAKKYLKYSAVESYRAYRKYQENWERLQLEPLSQGVIEAITQSVEDLCAEFGSNYKNVNGWASEELDNPYPRFSHLEEDVDFAHYRPWYKMASYHTHSSPKMMEFSLGLYDARNLLAAGPSNIGFVDPGQNMVITLNQMNAVLLTLPDTNQFRYKMSLIVRVLHNLGREIIDALLEVDEEIRKDEEILSKTEFGSLSELLEYYIAVLRDYLRYF